LLLGFVVRLYRFNNPIADWHSWRQADTSSVARNYVKNGIDLLHPRMNNISNVQSGFENPQGYFYTEFPLLDGAQAGLFMLFGHLTIEEWGRFITIVMSLMGSTFLFLLVKRRGYIRAAWLTLIFSLFLPYNIYYNRTILPDTSMVATLMGGIYFMDKWLDGFRGKKEKVQFVFLLLSLVFTAVSLLLKPYALFYGLTFLVLVFSVFKWKVFLKWELWMYAILAVLPLVFWRRYMLSYPEGIPVSNWLFNSNGIRFRPAFFRWIFYERVTKLISGFFNTLFIATGVYTLFKIKDSWFFLSFVVSALAYVCIIATGNVQHDYYQIVIMPALIFLMAFGAAWLIGILEKHINKKVAYFLVSFIILVGFYFSWQQVKDYFNINNSAIIEAGQVVDRLTPKNAKILAPYDGDSSFLYQTNRQGWASFEHDLPTLIKMGADYLVLVHPTATDRALGKQYKVVAQNQDYILVNLNQKP
jgi:hypothetical protein